MSKNQILTSLINQIVPVLEAHHQSVTEAAWTHHKQLLASLIAIELWPTMKEMRERAFIAGAYKANDINSLVEDMADFDDQVKAAAREL